MKTGSGTDDDDAFLEKGPGPAGLKVAEKLTDWTNEPKIEDLKADLQSTQTWHSIWVSNIRRWRQLRNPAKGTAKGRRGSQGPGHDNNRSKIHPKLIRRQNEWRYPSLSEPFLNNPNPFTVEPATFEDAASARQNGILLNHQFRTKLNRVKLIDDYIRAGTDEGVAVLKMGWSRKTRRVKKMVPTWQYIAISSTEELASLEQAVGMKANNNNGFLDLPPEMIAAAEYFLETGQPAMAQAGPEAEIEEIETLENHPTVDVLDPENVYIDPTCQGDIRRANFAIVTFESSKADLLSAGVYQNLDAVNWASAGTINDPDHQSNTSRLGNIEDPLRAKNVVHEYWGFLDIDGTETLTPVVVSWIGSTIIRCEKNPYPDEEIPLVVVPYMPVLRHLGGEPDAELLEDNQDIMGAVMRGIIDLLGRSANSQQGVARGFLDVTNRRKFDRGEDYEFNPGAGDPRLSIYQHVYPEIPNSAITMLNIQNQEAEALTGVKAFAGGLTGENYGDVAAGIKGVLDASGKREMSILRRMAKGMVDVATKIIAMNAVFLSEEEVVRITNEEFVKIRREDLKGNFDITVDIATAEMDAQRAQELGIMLQTIGPNAPIEVTMMLLGEIARLKRMPTLEKMLRDYKPQPDPLAQKRMELEIAKLQAEIDALNAKSSLTEAQIQKTLSETDAANLDFVLEETGTKHAQKLEVVSQQAQANSDLEITKALLAPKKPEERDPDIPAAMGFNALTDAKSRAPTGI